jgi:hypothetical protein
LDICEDKPLSEKKKKWERIVMPSRPIKSQVFFAKGSKESEKIGTFPFFCMFFRLFFISTVEDHRKHSSSAQASSSHVVSVGCYAMHDTYPRLAGLASDGYFSGLLQDTAE